MARLLFVVPPFSGHVNPTVSVARALTARGHETAWAAHADAVRPLLPADARLLPIELSVPMSVVTESWEQGRRLRGFARLKFLWDGSMLPLARAMVRGIDAAVDRFQPDVLVVDQQALAGAVVARRRGLAWATLATTSATLIDPLAGVPRVKEWVAARLSALFEEAGLEAVERPDLSPRLVVVFSSEALTGPLSPPLPQARFVGPSISDRPDPTPFPFDRLQPGPRLLVSLGTVNVDQGERFFTTVLEALAHQPLQVVLVAPEEELGPVPANFLVRRRIPQLAVLPHVHAVLCHAGHNTVCEALAHGLPLVVAPIKDDQPMVAQQVVAAGAGLRLRFGRVGPGEIAAAVDRVLREDGFRAAAARIRESFARAGGAARAAELLEELA